MRIVFAALIALTMMFASTTEADAERSKFQVESIKPASDGGLILTVSTNHFTNAAKAEFYLHTKVPYHDIQTVKSGVLAGVLNLKVGAEVHTIKVSKAAVAKLKLKPGASVYVAAHWPKFGHNWGTTFYDTSRTNFKLPKKSKVATAASNGPPAKETFPNGMPLQYSKPLWKGAVPGKPGKRGVSGKAQNDIGRAANIISLPPSARNFTEAGSLLESEGKVGIAKKKHLRATISILKSMSKNPKLAAKVLGAGWSVQYTATYSFADAYKDNAAHDLAKTEAGLRVRHVPGSGQPAQLNFKDPKGLRNGPEKIVMSRTERFVHLGKNPDLKGIVESPHYLNPMKRVLDKGGNPASYLNDSAKVLDKRVRFQLMYKDPKKSGAPQAVAEITADHVFHFESLQTQGKHKKVSFFGLEVDIAHQPVTGNGKSVDYIPGVKNWKPTHKPSDLKHLDKDKSIQKTYKAIGKLMYHLVDKGVLLRPTVPKYTEGLLRSGVIAPTTRMQKKILTRGKKSFLQSKKSKARTARRAAGRGRATTRARVR